MKKRIGNSDMLVAPLNLGGNVFGWTLDEKESFAILDEFVANGFNFIDTADVYSAWKPGNQGGESETILGKWMQLRKNRDKIVLATKVGWDFGDGRKGINATYIHSAIQDSLRRLQTDYVDLYYTHIDDEVTPVAETLGAYAELIQAGKVRYIAASNVTAPRLIESLELAQQSGLPQYQALQPHYNLLERQSYEEVLAPIAKQYNLSVMPYWALAAGFLTGKYRSEADLGKSVRGGGAKKYLNDKGLGVLNALDQVAAKHDSQPGTVALAWLLAQDQVLAPVASATSSAQLKGLFDATQLVLDADDLQRLDSTSK
ncbi:aldo/keto reductase [Spirosoma foliorum]|uniref:Aldo/keto reductase n=1 Tax=Spirosoma foliorum TaxID=2710596 RepID=A0A7G5GXK5_9BACT|nr:aldo/keto reductase [Spirosoma foliorum]QMW03597.1 aldo/keto reductase [Spirosoma foliorum]